MDNLTQPHLFAIARGKKLMASLLIHAQENQLKSASLSGLGALKNPTLGYYNLSEKKYQYKTFEGLYELISLNGNITTFKDDIVVHVHVALSDENYHLIAGHLQEAIVSVTAEITLIPFDTIIQRQLDAEINLNLILG